MRTTPPPRKRVQKTSCKLRTACYTYRGANGYFLIFEKVSHVPPVRQTVSNFPSRIDAAAPGRICPFL